MRVALIAPPWVAIPPPAYGGTETVLDTLASGLAEAGHEVVLWTTGDSTCPVPRRWVFDRALGVGNGGAAQEIRHTMAAYRELDADIVHDHTLVGPIIADRMPWLPVVTTNHGPFQSDLLALYQATSDRVPVIAISHHQAAGANGVHLAGIIHHGVDLGRFPMGPGGGGYALFLGRMNPDKGVVTAIHVARRAGIPLLIAAKMQEAAEQLYFTEAVAPLLGPDVEYVGEVGGQDKLDLLSRAHCLLNPIAWPEPFGMVMVEAMATGTPVVATPLGAAPEIVADGVTGYLRCDDPALAEAVMRVDQIDRDACRRRVETWFGADRMVAEHLAVYAEVVQARGNAVFGRISR
jgi:glycosyltransferase involved in cell wall biosynthesis